MFNTILGKESERYKKNADALITESGILDILKKYGTPVFVGSYAANLMMSADIDIHILREKPYKKELNKSNLTLQKRLLRQNSARKSCGSKKKIMT
ncbi:MAG: hypothetical protein A3C08_00505 [Candidatus Taylorbacteria bacterium RIFCSPHIGHO2_02_FULL_47_18]|uniref:Uncharacterized protein n=1 Tax=Candidatus Taylorbacteria bacterium RIFCSPLOWO2_01_FULL_48_100 TaxID=1802322 RepID=A0A1G2NFC4_9BACT|nr:MAG: hypothetical protein A2670_00220 [Candidatus Taylorbacteria bacterium RIFCSPHIGHO2_01_FULL_48_38]OHA27840.1 MAG: hypothetical protein A3C08_00505 [Candidatus Taylorbacteria bacterium RIFCSPHIGHO2_02_FULL_47_18]OHA34774.1 MAG: hypothetical protein A2938_03655 [Candidatus Taylorbacteria bacterium RIFCSPLOWO2_01_FULL_48_100]OHA40927.1 MAG: hypothetical protein A3J31_03950 [Candidatus Taylorbacteria bacterium RIFCSPLOWO2_02_FULL_48_16]OHA45063.1 MAG: hypothetical protein A3H13_02625 [Candid